jgi:molecular chaperone GrpE (heat shock protein)
MSYVRNLIHALLGRAPVAAPASPPGETEAALRARVAALEMDLRGRDERIAAMRKEYAALGMEGQREAAGAGQQQLQRLFKKLAAPLANFSALSTLAESGKQVEAADMASVFRSLEKLMLAAGLEPIGAAGESAAFDVALHQRISGAGVSAGAPVTVRAPGYRFAGEVLLKAMVTSKERGDE